MTYKIQQLRLGGILDQAILIFKNHFGLLLGIMCCALIPMQLISGFIQIRMLEDMLGDLANPEPAELLAPGFDQSYIFVTFGFAIVQGLIVLPLTNAAIIYAVAQNYLGHSVTILEAIKTGLSKIVPLIWTSILMGLAIMGGLILCIIPGILFAIWFGLAQHVVVLEHLSGTAALGRSRDLVRPYFGTFLGLMIIVFVIAFFIGSGSAFVPNMYLQLVVQVILNAVVTMLSTAAVVIFYFSCRSGLENFDLELLAQSVGENVPATDSDERGFLDADE